MQYNNRRTKFIYSFDLLRKGTCISWCIFFFFFYNISKEGKEFVLKTGQMDSITIYWKIEIKYRHKNFFVILLPVPFPERVLDATS